MTRSTLRLIPFTLLTGCFFFFGEGPDSDSVDTGDTTDVRNGDFPVAPSDPDAKPKDTLEDKLERIAAGPNPPSALAGAFFHQARAWASGRAPGSEIEREAFAILDATSPDVQDAILRVLAAADQQDPGLMGAVYDASFLDAPASAVLTADALASAVAAEILGNQVLAPRVDTCRNETPGAPRVESCFDIDRNFDGLCPRICEVVSPGLSVRTNGCGPALSAG